MSLAYVSVLLTESTREYDQPYTYYYDDQELDLVPGHLIKVPFGRADRKVQAVVTAILSRDQIATPNIKFKKVISKIQEKPIYNCEQLKLAEEMRRRYFCSTGQALRTIAPSAVLSVKAKSERYAALVDPTEISELLAEGRFRSIGQIRVLEMLLSYESCSFQEINQSCSVSNAVITRLAKQGYIKIFRKSVKRDSVELKTWSEKSIVELTAAQEQVIKRVSAKLDFQNYAEFLLQGVTGSGKTEVYLQLAEQVLAAGREVIILVPEISLTPLMTGRIVSRFGNKAAILHSRLTATERYEQWSAIAAGEKRLVVGARSAVFAPLQNIGLIVIDEEQESTYISEVTPRYDAADIARLRCLYNKCVLLLGSATPKITTRYRTQIGKCELLELPERVSGRKLPEVQVIPRNGLHVNSQVFSTELKAALNRAFNRGEQAILFHNRRGRSHNTRCLDCGENLYCEHCNISLKQHNNLHRSGHKYLVCHYCGSIYPLPKHCPKCGSDNLYENGAGTQAIESEFIKIFPDRRILRMDADTTTGRGNHDSILRAFAAGEADCLLGTQMIAKGHDFPSVTVVGIISADDLLNGFSYRAAEKGFQLITQAAGRAGRAEHSGCVYVQVQDVDNYGFQYAIRQDYNGFYVEELQRRKTFNYPPFTSLGVIMLSGYEQEEIVAASHSLSAWLDKTIVKNKLDMQNLGAGEAPINRINRRWRQRIVLKSSRIDQLYWLLDKVTDLKFKGDYRLTCQINGEV